MKTTKRLSMLILTLFIIGITVFAVSDRAAAITDSLEYEVISKKDKTCKITDSFISGESSIVIPSKIDGYKVVALGEYAFSSCYIKSITIPSTVEIIEEDCFFNSEGVKKIIFSKGLKKICDGAFEYSGVEEIVLPSTVTEIGNEAFNNCKSLKYVTIPSSVKKVGTNLFADCSALKKADFLCNIPRVPDKTFHTCSSLEEVNLSAKISEIGSEVFWDCFKLTTVKFSGAEKNVKNCSYSSSIPKGNVVIPGSVKIIDKSAFSDCDSIKNVFIGEGTTKLGTWAFALCDSLEYAVLPASLTYAGEASLSVYSPFSSTKAKIHNKPGSCLHTDTHNYITTVVKPTCAKGYTEYNCECGFTDKVNYTDAVISKHKTVNITAVKATTSQEGRTAGSYCSVCNTVFKQSVKVAKVKGVELSASSLVYSGKTKKPKVTVTDKNGKTISSSSYKVTFPKKSVNIGTYTVKVKLTGNYSGSFTKTYKILPKGISASKISRIPNGFKIKWKKQTTKTKGYQLQYSTSKDFKKAKTVTVSKNTTTEKSIKKLTEKKNYYIRLRSYTTVDKKKYYSSWSDTYKVNIVKSTAKVIPQLQKVYEDSYGDKEYQDATDDSLSVYYTVNSNYPGYRVYSVTLYKATSKDGEYKKVGTTDEAYFKNWHHQYAEKLKSNKAYYFKVVPLFVPKECDTEKEFKKLTAAQKIYDETSTAEKFWTCYSKADVAGRNSHETTSSTLKWSAVKGATGYIIHESVLVKAGYNIFGNAVFDHYEVEFISKTNSAKSVIKSKASRARGKESSYTVTPYVKRGDVYYVWGEPLYKGNKLKYDKKMICYR